MHSLRSSSHSYTSSQQSAVSYMSTDSTSNKIWQVQRTTTESNVTTTMQRVVSSSETLSPHTTEHGVDRGAARSISPDGDSVLNTPPALPQKTRSKQRRDRQLSTYDNVPSDMVDEFHSSNHQEQHVLSCSMHQSQTIQHGSCRSPEGKPPPLPLKKKHSECYLILFVCVKCEV
jgi:hypothetical protein